MDPISILIVNFNGADRTAACLAALELQTFPRYRFEVIVVDNASTDDSRSILPSRFPWVRFVFLSRNLGFAGGNNVAATYAHGRLRILLNNDTVPDPFWLEELVLQQERDPDAVIASKLVFEHDPEQVNSAGLFLLRDGRGVDAGFCMKDRGQFEAGGPIFGGCGAAVTTRCRDDGQLLDPWLFLYYEDLDAAWLQRLQGKRAVLASRSLVLHAHGASAGAASPVFRFHVERNRAITSLRNGDFFLAAWAGLVLALKVPQAFVRAMTQGRQQGHGWEHALAVFRAFRAYLARLPLALVERYLIRNWRCPR